MSRSPDSRADQAIRLPASEKTPRQSADAYLAGWQATLQLLRQGKSWSGHERNRAFLNMGASSQDNIWFADVSAVTGLDFPDDGRGLAVVDWDGDGDLDLWLANRTGPKLRLMQNSGTNGGTNANTFVAFRLRGTTSNRDAIGARVEVVLGQGAAPLTQTLYAGDGFLSQSSKWLHFGLGKDPNIERVLVRWPGGDAETFSGVRPGGRYHLVEGSGKASAAVTRPKLGLEPRNQEPPTPAAAERAFLPVRIPLPRLRYARFENLEDNPIEVGMGPLLINFWATWCLPCVAELTDLTEHQQQLNTTGLDILALSVDGLAQDQATRPDDAQRLLRRLGFPFASGMANTDLLAKIERMDEILFDRSRPFAVPTSLLLDRDGQLAAIYRGRLDLEVLLGDVASLDASPKNLHAASAPVPGRWIAELSGLDPEWLAQQFRGRHPEDVERYLELALVDRQSSRAKSQHTESHPLDKEEAALYLALAEAVYNQGQREKAILHLRRAIELNRNLGPAHATLANLLGSAGLRAEAIRHYLRAIEIDPEDAESHHGLGIGLRTVGRLDEAFQHLAAAARLRPEWPAPLIPMVWMLVTAEPDGAHGKDAIRLARRAVELSEDRHPVALDTLAAAYAAEGRYQEAIATAREAAERATALGNETLAKGIQERLRRYDRGLAQENSNSSRRNKERQNRR